MFLVDCLSDSASIWPGLALFLRPCSVTVSAYGLVALVSLSFARSVCSCTLYSVQLKYLVQMTRGRPSLKSWAIHCAIFLIALLFRKTWNFPVEQYSTHNWYRSSCDVTLLVNENNNFDESPRLPHHYLRQTYLTLHLLPPITNKTVTSLSHNLDYSTQHKPWRRRPVSLVGSHLPALLWFCTSELKELLFIYELALLLHNSLLDELTSYAL